MKKYKLNNKISNKRFKRNKIYWGAIITIVIIVVTFFIYFIPINFMKFISWLGNNEKNISINVK